MTRLPTRFAAGAAVLLALTLTPALSGCSVQSIIENATGGKVDVGGKSVPKDFPSDVPLVDGEIIYGGGLGDDKNKAWNVLIKVGDLAVFDTIKSDLEAAGFTANTDIGGAAEQGATGAFDSDKYTVLVVVAKDNKDGVIANYTVTTKN